MNLLDIQIETDRLILRAIEEGDVKDIFETFTEEVSIFMYPQPSGKIGDIESFIKDSRLGLKEGSNLQLVIIHKERDEFLGCCGLHNLNESKPELGIWLKKNAHGYGYGLEAIGSIIEWARLKVKFEHLKYPVDRRNKSSRKIPEHFNGSIVHEYELINMLGNALDIVEYWIS